MGNKEALTLVTCCIAIALTMTFISKLEADTNLKNSITCKNTGGEYVKDGNIWKCK